MRIGLGIFCSTSDNSLSTNHTFRLKNLSRERVMAALVRNIEDLHGLLRLSKGMGLRVFRLGSSFVPYASHPAFRREWREEAEGILRSEAERVRGYGVRITMHPGQYVVLNSPRQSVVDSSLREMEYHFWVLDSLGMGEESVVVVHLGGVYGDRRKALGRLEEVVDSNPWLRRRLAIENDERHYSIEEVVELAESLGVPAVFDHYHHRLNPSRLDAGRLVATWRGRVPEVHLSSPPEEPGRWGEHGDYVDPRDLLDLAKTIPDTRIDVIIEAKKKEKAVERLLADLGRLGVRLEEL